MPRRKKSENIPIDETSNQNQQSTPEDFDVFIASESTKDNTIIITSAEMAQKWLENAMSNYDANNRIYSAYLNDNASDSILDSDLLDKLSVNPQSNINDIKTINNIIRKQINCDVMIGKTYETLQGNVNTSYKISYNDFSSNRNKNKTLERAKTIINDFNSKINIEKFLCNLLPTTYAEGNFCTYLRSSNGNYTVDTYPLGVVLVSNYEVNGEPYLLVDIAELTSRLRKDILKNKKGKALFFESVEEDIKQNYPPEVYDAYKNKEKYAILDIKYSGISRIGNMNRKYGLSPLFRALRPTVILDTFENTDKVNSKAKAKKIIFQKLRKEVMGTDYDKDGFAQMSYSHSNLMNAWRMPTVVVTAPAYVEEISYIEPQVENTQPETMEYYTRQKALALGISFLSNNNGMTVTTSSISVKELIKIIDKILLQASDILNKWYRVILLESGIDIEYAPTISINSSEELDFEMRKSLSEFLFTKLSSSYETAYSCLKIDLDDEKQKRISENAEKMDEIFKVRQTSFTSSGSYDKGGAPSGEPSKKQDYDKTRNGT